MAANFKRTPIPIRDAKERIQDFKEVVLGYSKSDSIEEASRCIDCKKPLCVPSCPAGINIPGFITEIKKENYTESLRIILENMPLTNICGRVCTRQCEDTCIKNRKGGSLEIMELKRSASTYCNEEDIDIKCAPDTGKKVAVIGSGPAGLSAAYFLRLKGHKVVVYEQKHK
ncbi:glutamate synthase beta subunit, putative, partial [Entamoeba invadens IP1]